MSRFLYTLLLCIALPFVPLKLLWRGLKQPAYREHWLERFGFYTNVVEKPIIWLHCVSVGETHAAVPLIKALQHAYPKYQILITHTTPTGRAASEKLFDDDVLRVYLPYDVPFAINGFLNHFKPKIGLLMETELWFNLIAACSKRDTPILLMNARLSEKSATGYAKLGKLAFNGLSQLSAISAQTLSDAKRLAALGANNITVTGNLKFDVKPPADSKEKGVALRTLFGETRSVFLAASTREGEEAMILDAVHDLAVLTVIVPRHPQRFDDVAHLLQQRNIPFVRRSNLNQPITTDTQVVLGDSMGELYTYYAACDFTFIGGSLLNFGGQNLIEAAVMAKPILLGPHTFNFAEASETAVEKGAALRVNDVEELSKKIQLLIMEAGQRETMSRAAIAYSQAATGTTQKMMIIIAPYLSVKASLVDN
ncbi:MAG: lipid IV(A) 3-deoxy-D-manno-octulosonic acid transferase [Methylotenera sp.]